MTHPPTGDRPSGPRSAAATTVVLLVAHGSRNPAASVEHERLCAAVQQQLDREQLGVVQPGPGNAEVPAPRVRPAYLEITQPDIATAVDSAVADGATSVRLLPHFLAPGNHVAVDLPRIADEARSRHPGVHIELLEHLGADPALVGLLARRAARA